MRTAAFARGVGDKRSGRPPRYDDFMFDQDAGDHMAKATINAHWHYERGRQAPSAADTPGKSISATWVSPPRPTFRWPSWFDLPIACSGSSGSPGSKTLLPGSLTSLGWRLP